MFGFRRSIQPGSAGSICRSDLHEAFLWVPVIHDLGPDRIGDAQEKESQLSGLSGGGAYTQRPILVCNASQEQGASLICVMASSDESSWFELGSTTPFHRALQHFAVPLRTDFHSTSPLSKVSTCDMMETKPTWTLHPQYILAIIYAYPHPIREFWKDSQQATFSVDHKKLKGWRDTRRRLLAEWIELLKDKEFCEEACREASVRGHLLLIALSIVHIDHSITVESDRAILSATSKL